MTTEGFVKLPRTMLEWQWLDDGNTLKVYLVLLLLANWKDAEWHGIKLKRGQLITSYPKIAERCGMSVQEIRTAFGRLKSTGDLTVKTTSKFSIVTLNNYDLPEETTVKSTGGQQTANSQSTEYQQADNSQSTTVEESKEEKEIKEQKESEEAAASPPPSPIVFENSYNSLPTSNPVTREQLVEKYGSENVAVYERKFDIWTYRRGITGGVNKYGTIAKWLAEDGVVKRESSFDTDEVMKRIIARYKS